MKWQQALKDYQSYLRIERGLSENSISNYGLDIKKLIPEAIHNYILHNKLYNLAGHNK